MDSSADEKRRSFEAEALPHLDAVYRFARSLTRDAQRAEDLAQEAMLKAYRSWHQYRPGTNARAWLLTIVRNTFINQYRRQQHEGTSVDLGEMESYTAFPEVQERDPEGKFFDRIVDEEVLRAIEELPEEFREVVVLSDLEDLSYAEIAELLGVPVGTVKSRLFRARQALQRKLYEYAVEMGYIKSRAK
ncbi:MAG: RNA polymerase sigma factor RpoE [Gemmatimonadales bacterium]|nr:MAG: RNA polymerase sigma factor RpoE [Gemmatimonadales bacterium]